MELIQARKISRGSAEGEALVTNEPISFYGGVDPATGVVVEKGHELEGQTVAGKILVFPKGKGSTVGSYTLLRLRKAGKAPKAIINANCDPIVAVGAIISDIPAVDKLERPALAAIKTGTKLKIDADGGLVEILG